MVRKNLKASFPQSNLYEIKAIEKGFYHNLCDVIIETVKLLHISKESLRRRVTVTNPEIINDSLLKGVSTTILLGHYGNWEWVQEIGDYFLQDVYRGSIYHRMRSELWDKVFLAIRSRWHMHILPQDRAVRALLDKTHRPWSFGFIADQRPAVFTTKNNTAFLNHTTYFITGPEEIGRKVGSDFFYLEIVKIKRGHYILTFKKINGEGFPQPFPVMRQFYHLFEQTIIKQSSLWLWSHNRWHVPPTVNH